MNIKQRIIVSFTVVVAAILVLFSVSVYYSYEDYRADLMRDRLFLQAEAAKKLIAPETFDTNQIIPLNGQYRAVYDEQNSLLSHTKGASDFTPDEAFLRAVRTKKRYAFNYKSAAFDFEKEGVALPYMQDGKRYLVIVTAYDLHGFNVTETLRHSLLLGNLIALLVIAVTGYFFSRRAMSPFDRLIKQMDQAAISDFGFRIGYNSEENEATSLARSFNRLLEKTQQLADNQKSFIAYASHELRTPLTIVKGVLQTSLAYDNNQDWRNSVREAVGEVNVAIELSNNLLFLAEMESVRFTVDKTDINIVDLVMDSIAITTQKFPQQPINFEIVQADPLHDLQAVTEGISHLLRSAINNVLDNACKYSDFKPVNIEMREEGKMIRLLIKDQGIGILAGDLENIFLPMMRGRNAGHVDGFGIGLTLVQKIIGFHNGKLTISSIASGGTSVEISLPRKKF